jgi:hypothetical protein
VNGLRPNARLGTEDLYVRWRKGSIDSVHTLARDEVSVLRKWPRVRVLYSRTARRFIIRTDRQLHRATFVRLIAARFRIAPADAMVLSDDQPRNARRVPCRLREEPARHVDPISVSVRSKTVSPKSPH